MRNEIRKLGYGNLSRAFAKAQYETTPVIRLDDDPFNILTKLQKKFKTFKDFPPEQKPRVMIVNLLNVSKNPGSDFHPIAMGYLISAIRSLDPQGVYKDGKDSNLLYYNEYLQPQNERTDEKFIEAAKKFNPDMVLFTATTSQTKRVGGAISLLKHENIKPLTVVGGVDATIQPQVCLDRTKADIAIIGEGQIPVKMLVTGWKDSTFPLRIIPGLVVSEPAISTPTESATFYGKPVYFEDIDKYDQPKVPLTEDEKKNGWEMTVTRAIGCPYNCPFCGATRINKETTGHRAVRMKSEQSMLDEIEFGLQNNVKSIYFADDTLFLSAQKTTSFLEKFKDLQQKYAKDGAVVPWIASSRIGEINRNPELLKLAVEAGCVEIEVGKETGSDKLTKKINKVGNYNKDLMTLMDHLREFPTLKLGINFIIGLPGATFEDEMETIRLAGNILDRNQPVAFHIHKFTPLPGTDYWDNPEEHGLKFNREAIMDRLSTYGVENLVRSKSITHNQTVLVDEILNTVLRAKGAVSFRSPYLAALTIKEQHEISTFVTPGESAREIQQASLMAAKREIDMYRQLLNGHIGASSLAQAVKVVESRERYVLSMQELLRLSYLVVNRGYILPEYIERESTPEKEANKDLDFFLKRISMIRYHRLRQSNPLIRGFSKNLIENSGGKRVPVRDLDQFERTIVFRRLRKLGNIRSSLIYERATKLDKGGSIAEHEVDLNRRQYLRDMLLSGKIQELIDRGFSPKFSDRWIEIGDRKMLGGHDFSIAGHTTEMLNKFILLAKENNIVSDDFLIGATAGLLHDIGKLGGEDDYYHPLRSAAISRKIIDEFGCFSSEEKQRILALIEHHALIGNLTIHGEHNEYPKDNNDVIKVNGKNYSKGRLYAIGPISDNRYIAESLKSFKSHSEDLKILLQLQIADTYAVKKDGALLTETTIQNFYKTYLKLRSKI